MEHEWQGINQYTYFSHCNLLAGFLCIWLQKKIELFTEKLPSKQEAMLERFIFMVRLKETLGLTKEDLGSKLQLNWRVIIELINQF